MKLLLDLGLISQLAIRVMSLYEAPVTINLPW